MIASKYIIKTVLISIVSVIIAVAGIDFIFEFTHEFSDVGNGQYDWIKAAKIVPLMLPNTIYMLSPILGLLGSLIGMGNLASKSELVIMRASGMSPLNISSAIAKAAFIFAALMILLGEVIAPSSQHKAIVKKTEALSSGQTLMTNQGMWLRDKDSFIHIEKAYPNGNLKSILRYKIGQKYSLQTTSFASKGFYEKNGWLMKEITKSHIEPHRVTSETIAEQKWTLPLNPRMLKMANLQAEQKSLKDLFQSIKFRKKNGLSTENYELVFWRRIFSPLAIVIMTLLSAPFVFGFLRHSTLGLRIIFGVAVGTAFYVSSQFASNLSLVMRFPAFIAAITPVIIFSLLLVILHGRLTLAFIARIQK